MEFHLDQGSILKHQYTDEGYLRCYARIARSGDLKYINADGSERIEYVSPDVLFDKESIDSFKMKAVTDTHPPVILDAKNTSQYARGMSSNVAVKEITVDGDFLGLALTVTDESLIGDIVSGRKKQVSCGYMAETRKRSDGKWEQLKRKGNHIAIVEQGRAGSAVDVKVDSAESVWYSDSVIGDSNLDEKIISDSFDKIKEDTVIKNFIIDKFMKTIVLDGEEMQLEDSFLASHVKKVDKELQKLRSDAAEAAKLRSDAQSEVEALKAEIATLKASNEALQGRCDGLETVKSELETKVGDLEAAKTEVKEDSVQVDIAKEVQERIDAWMEVKPYFDSIGEEIKIDGGMSKKDIRLAALKKKYPEKNFDGKSEEYLDGVYESMTWGASKKDAAEEVKEDSVDTSKQVDDVLASIAANRQDSNSGNLDFLTEYRKSLENGYKNS